MLMPKESEFKLKYHVPTSEIDAQTLIDSLIGITTIVQEANKSLDGTRRVNVHVKAIGEGSFIIHLELLETNVLNAIASLFTIEGISNLLTILVNAIQLRKWHKESKETKEYDDGETLTIENSDGNTITINRNVYNITATNPIIIKAADKTLEALAENKELTGFDILDQEKNKLLEITQDDLRLISAYKPDDEEEDYAPRLVTRNATLKVVKPSFERHLKWEFGYLGARISALIKDGTFLDKVENREETFASGDTLDVDLLVEEEWNRALKGYVPKRYEVVKVKFHFARSQQLSIPEDELKEKPTRRLVITDDD